MVIHILIENDLILELPGVPLKTIMWCYIFLQNLVLKFISHFILANVFQKQLILQEKEVHRHHFLCESNWNLTFFPKHISLWDSTSKRLCLEYVVSDAVDLSSPPSFHYSFYYSFHSFHSLFPSPICLWMDWQRGNTATTWTVLPQVFGQSPHTLTCLDKP